jgi:hypothetical protein
VRAVPPGHQLDELDELDELEWQQRSRCGRLDGRNRHRHLDPRSTRDRANGAEGNGDLTGDASPAGGFSASFDAAETETVSITFGLRAAGTDDCGSNHDVVFTYVDGKGDTYRSNGVGGGSCAVTVTAYGAVGEKVEGTFNGAVPRISGTVGADHHILNGTFSFTRTE